MYYRSEMRKMGYGDKVETKTQFKKYITILLRENLISQREHGLYVKDPLNFIFIDFVNRSLIAEESGKKEAIKVFEPELPHTYMVKNIGKFHQSGVKLPVIHIEFSNEEIFTKSPTYFFEKLLNVLSISKFNYHYTHEHRFLTILKKVSQGKKLSKKEKAFYEKNAAPTSKATSEDVTTSKVAGIKQAQVSIAGLRETRSKSRYAQKKSIANGVILSTILQRLVVPKEELDKYSIIQYPFRKAYEKLGVLQAASVWQMSPYHYGCLQAKNNYQLNADQQKARLSEFSRVVKGPTRAELINFFKSETIEVPVTPEPELSVVKKPTRIALEWAKFEDEYTTCIYRQQQIYQEKLKTQRSISAKKEAQEQLRAYLWDRQQTKHNLSDTKIFHELGRLTEFGIYDLFPDLFMQDVDIMSEGKNFTRYLTNPYLFDTDLAKAFKDYKTRIIRKMNDTPNRKGGTYADATRPYRGCESGYNKPSKKGDHAIAFKLVQDTVRKNLPAEFLESLEDPDYLSYLIRESKYSPRIFPVLFFACTNPEHLISSLPQYNLSIWHTNSLRMIDMVICDTVALLEGNEREKNFKGSNNSLYIPGYLDISYGIFRYLYGYKFSGLELSPSGFIRLFDIPYIPYSERVTLFGSQIANTADVFDRSRFDSVALNEANGCTQAESGNIGSAHCHK